MWDAISTCIDRQKSLQVTEKYTMLVLVMRLLYFLSKYNTQLPNGVLKTAMWI